LSQDFSTTALLASIKRRGMLNSNSDALDDSDYLAVATEELQSYVQPWLLSLREEYGVADYDVSTVAGTAAYRLPPRAAGDSLRNALILANADYVPLRRMEPEAVHYEYPNLNSSAGVPVGYYFKDQDLVLVPTPSAAGSLRLQYHKRPAKLVATSAAAVVQSINGDRTTITTTATIPSTITASSISVDVVDATPGFKTLAMDYTTTTGTTGTTIVLTAALPSSVGAGDYVTLAGEAPVAQIPVEVHTLLAQRTKTACLEALGDPKWQAADAVCERMKRELLPVLAPRSKGSARYLVNRNGPGW
jgi:hypothetical protein